MTSYNFSIQNDFLNHKINAGKLATEIQQSSITIALDSINTEDDLCVCIFKASLSESEITTLNSLIAQHTGEEDIIPLAYKTDAEGKIIIATGPTVGSSVTLASHNFCDKCSWYGQSIREIGQDGYGEILIPQDGYQIYNSNHTHWIDLTHGRVTKEDDVKSGKEVIVLVNDQVQVEDQDFIVNYEDGYVEFADPLSSSDVVRAKYNYANKSTYTICPPTGKKYRMLYTEVQFTQEVKIVSPVRFELFVYNPYNPMGPKVKYNTGVTEVYKNAKDFVNVNNDGRVIPKFGEFESDVIVMPFKYATCIDLDSRYGTELRITIDNDVELQGQFATITMYCLIEDV